MIPIQIIKRMFDKRRKRLAQQRKKLRKRLISWDAKREGTSQFPNAITHFFFNHGNNPDQQIELAHFFVVLVKRFRIGLMF